MDEKSRRAKKLEWKWVGITLLLYVVMYPLPLLMAYYLFAPKVAGSFVGIWIFAGIIIIGAFAGYLSKGVTLWEPAIAAAGFIGLFFLALAILPGGPVGLTVFESVMQLILITAIFFLFSLLGAWLGERAQVLWKPKG